MRAASDRSPEATFFDFFDEARGVPPGTRTLADLSIPILQLPGDTPVPEVEWHFRNDPSLRTIAVSTEQGPVLLTLRHLEARLSGRLGYGRALLSRAHIHEILQWGQPVLHATDRVLHAANALLNVLDRLSDDEVLVVDERGRTYSVSLISVFRETGLFFRDLAMRDQLTNLANRRSLEQSGEQLLSHGADLTRIAVLYIDLDGFKQINDTLGHRAGDELLIAFARRLSECVRSRDAVGGSGSDVIGRIGGDEFAVLLSDVDEKAAAEIAERIVAATHHSFVIGGQTLYVSASVGLATGREILGGTPALSTLDTLLQRADGALLHAKRAGKARVGRSQTVYDAGPLARRALIHRRLGNALADGALRLHYQPKLDLRTGRTDTVEGLARWSDDELGPVSPDEFIPAAEQAGLIHALGSWVLRTACAQARSWSDGGQQRVIAVNISPTQLAEHGFVDEVLRAVGDAGIPPTLLQIEITESVVIDDLSLAVQQLTDLRLAGVAVHLDDFGAGHSSLARLRALPLYAIKIDRHIVARVDTDAADAHLLAGVISAAHTLGLRVIAEGVERQSQLERLEELGCDAAQGYLIGRPAPASLLPADPVGDESASARDLVIH